MDLINATPLLEPTETAVILAIVDEFNKARMAERRGNSVKVLDPQIESFNNNTPRAVHRSSGVRSQNLSCGLKWRDKCHK